MATGELLTFIDADDTWHQQKTAWQLEAFSKAPALDICFGKIQQFVSPELPEEIKNTIQCPDKPQKGILKQAMMVRRNVFSRVGLFPERNMVEFVEWYLKTQSLEIKTHYLENIIAYRRLHQANKSHEKKHYVEYAHLFKTLLDKQRMKTTVGNNN